MPLTSATAASLPSDPNQHGYIGFCNETGHNVTGGTVNATPFVWKAVASTPPPAAYLGRGENAILNIYQPRPDVDPSDWSGDSLTAASYFSTAKHPAVQATYADLSLATIIREYPPEVDGMYQLRMFFGRTNYGTYGSTYPATTIRVVGNTWSVVSGGKVDCGQAAGVSNEALTGAVSRREITPHKVAAPVTAPRTAAGGGTAGSAVASGSTSARSSSAASGGSHGSAGGSPQSSGAGSPGSIGASPVAETRSGASGSSGGGVLWGVGGGLLGGVVIAVVSMLFLRARRARSTPAG